MSSQDRSGGHGPSHRSGHDRKRYGSSAQARQRVEESRRKSRKAGKGARGPVAVLVILVLVVAAGVFAWQHFAEKPVEVATGEEVLVTIPDGATTSDIADILKENRVIASSKDFVAAVKAANKASQLKPGTYKIVGGSDVNAIVDLLVEGKTGYTLTIPEGFTARQVAERVAQTCGVDAGEFYELTQSASRYKDDYAFLDGAYDDSMEGYLFPKTYEVPFGSSADDVLRAMLDQFAAEVANVDMAFAESKNLTRSDIVILASMVEKESRSAEDKARIASVFYNRLHAQMNLGSDVTTYYAVGKELTEPLTNEDLASDSPYNTRNPNVKGLPAGPICNPGMDSLEAAAHPDDTKHLYFFYSNSKGKTMFFDDQASFDAAWQKFGD